MFIDCFYLVSFFLFKQKTAYEMRISDWSSDVCSSDLVVLRDAKTGKILAKGLTAGGTGDTKKIMEAVGRSPRRTTPDAAHYSTTLDISVPTLVKVELRGPLGRPLTMQRATSERWLVPGISAGAGWVVELPGLAIEVDGVSAMIAGRAATVTAKVAMMCGCPITPGGLWAAADYVVAAELRPKGCNPEKRKHGGEGK